MRLYYQVRYPGQYTLHLPSSVKLTYKGKNFTVSLPFKTLNINFTGELYEYLWILIRVYKHIINS